MCIWFRWKCWHLILIGLIFGWISSIYVLFVMLFYLLWSMNIEAIEELTKYPSWKSPHPYYNCFLFLSCPFIKMQHLILNSSLNQKTLQHGWNTLPPSYKCGERYYLFFNYFRTFYNFLLLPQHTCSEFCDITFQTCFAPRVNTVIIIGNRIVFLVQPVHINQGVFCTGNQCNVWFVCTGLVF